jgi:hypothetical protein
MLNTIVIPIRARNVGCVLSNLFEKLSFFFETGCGHLLTEPPTAR